MRKALVLLCAIILVAGCVSNKGIKEQRERLTIVESRQNKQDTELEVIRKDILLGRESLEELTIRLNNLDRELLVIDDMQSELDATGEDLFYMQDELITLKNTLADALDKNAMLDQRITDIRAALQEDLASMRGGVEERLANLKAYDDTEIRSMVEGMMVDSDDIFDAFTDNLAEIKGNMKKFVTRDEMTAYGAVSDTVVYTPSGVVSDDINYLVEGLQSDINDLRGIVLEMQSEYQDGDLANRLNILESEVASLRTDGAKQIAATTGKLAEDNKAVMNNVEQLKQRVDYINKELSAITGDLEGVISKERAKREQTRIQGINARYKAALNLYNERKYEQSIVMFEDFIAEYPNETLTVNAYYWIGENYYAGKKWSTALDMFRRVLDVYPNHHKVSDARLKAAMCYMQLEMKPQAYEELVMLRDGNPKYERMDLVTKYLRLTEN